MTPERIAELREDYSTHTSHCLVHKRTLADLLATAEREAKLREAIEGFTEGFWIDPDGSKRDVYTIRRRDIDLLRAALATKGGE